MCATCNRALSLDRRCCSLRKSWMSTEIRKDMPRLDVCTPQGFTAQGLEHGVRPSSTSLAETVCCPPELEAGDAAQSRFPASRYYRSLPIERSRDLELSLHCWLATRMPQDRVVFARPCRREIMPKAALKAVAVNIGGRVPEQQSCGEGCCNVQLA